MQCRLTVVGNHKLFHLQCGRPVSCCIYHTVNSTHVVPLQAHHEQCPIREQLANVHAQ